MTTLPTYPWFDVVPEHLRTRRQLAEQGLRPGGPIVAKVVWHRGERWANLYDATLAKRKLSMTEAQAAALEKARQAKRRCYGCGEDTGMILWRGFRPERDCPHCYEADLRYQRQQRADDRMSAARDARTWITSPRTVVLDTETTDLYGYVVQIAVIRAHDRLVLLDTLINPEYPIEPDAQRIHGISAEMVKDAPTFAAIEPQLAAVLRGKRIVTYNASFDENILRNEIHRLTGANAAAELNRWLRPKRWRCAMEAYAAFCGQWSSYHGSYKWQPLMGGDHSALGDCRATLALLQRMAEHRQTEELQEELGR